MADERSRVDDLLAEMTTAEKAGQLTQYFYFGFMRGAEDGPTIGGIRPSPELVEAAMGRGEVGSLLFVTDPAETNRLQRLAVEGNRHGIPVLFGYDVIHGLRTILPVPIAMAASWDPEAIAHGQSVAAREARAVGIHWAFAPMVDIARDPRWGRMIEGAGEDPFLGAAVAAAQVRGFQGEAIGTARARHRRAEALRRLRRRARRARLRRGQPVRFRAVERLSAAVRGGGRGRRRQRDDRLHDPQRHSRDRQPVAVHRRAAGSARLRGLRRQRRQRGPQSRDARLRRGPGRCGRPGGERRGRHGDGDGRRRLQPRCPRRSRTAW